MTNPAASPGGRSVTAVGSIDEALGAWRAFIQAHARVTRRLDDELQAAHGLSLAEYETLLVISQTPDHRIRMNALADRVLLSRSGVTRLIDRLVANGSVRRLACPTDLRGAEATITALGFARLQAASATAITGIERAFTRVLEPAELAVIERSLGRVAARLDAEPTSCVPGEGNA